MHLVTIGTIPFFQPSWLRPKIEAHALELPVHYSKWSLVKNILHLIYHIWRGWLFDYNNVLPSNHSIWLNCAEATIGKESDKMVVSGGTMGLTNFKNFSIIKQTLCTKCWIPMHYQCIVHVFEKKNELSIYLSLLFMYPVFPVGHRHFHTCGCNEPILPHELLEHHKAIITYVLIFFLCSCNAIYLLLTSFDRSLNRSWSCEVKHWIMSQVPSAGMPNLGQKGPSTYGCRIKFYVIIGSDGAMRRIHWKWIDI